MANKYLKMIALWIALVFVVVSPTFAFDFHTGVAGGSDTEVQFNDGGQVAGDTGMVFNKTTDTLTVTNLIGTAYGSDGSVSDAELLYTNTLSSNAQTQIDTKLATDGSGANLTSIPLDSDFGSNGLMERTGAGTYGIATADTDYEPALIDEASLYSTLSDVTQFIEAGDAITLLDGTNWRVFCANGSGDIVEVTLGADGTFFESNGASALPAFRALVFGDLPTLDALKLKKLTSLPTSPNVIEIFQFDNDTSDPADVPGTPNYLGMLTRNTTELMPNQVDRDFSGASAWANVDLNAYNETTGLTITATAADQYCTLVVASAPTTVGKRYRMTYDLANIVSTWTLKSFDGTQTIGTISANASQGALDWTATTTGGYRIVATSTTSSGDFDNFTLNELPYRAIMDENGRIYASSIEMPSYTHFANGKATYNDTTNPHLLTLEEMKGGLITNAQTGVPVDKVYTCQPAAFGMNFPVQVIAAAQMDLEPASGEALTLNGTTMAVDEHIQNTADTKWDVMSCWSVETGEGTYEICCKSDNANWVEATP